MSCGRRLQRLNRLAETEAICSGHACFIGTLASKISKSLGFFMVNDTSSCLSLTPIGQRDHGHFPKMLTILWTHQHFNSCQTLRWTKQCWRPISANMCDLQRRSQDALKPCHHARLARSSERTLCCETHRAGLYTLQWQALGPRSY